MLNLTAAAAAFVVLHLFPSTPWRRIVTLRLGEGRYLALFSLISLAAFIWLVWAFTSTAYGDKMWDLPQAWLWLKAALILFAFVLVAAGYLTPNPSMPGAGKALSSTAAKGVFAITRHPLMWGIAIWAIAHMLSQATSRGILFFGSLAVVALLGAWLQERRKRNELGAPWLDFERRTSFWPFAALIAGRARFSFADLGWWRVAVAVAAWAAVLHFHGYLFGSPPLPVGA